MYSSDLFCLLLPVTLKSAQELHAPVGLELLVTCAGYARETVLTNYGPNHVTTLHRGLR